MKKTSLLSSEADIEACYDELRTRGLTVWQPPYGVDLPILLVRGIIPAASFVAIVGSRAVDAYGRACARQVARLVVDLGFNILSGGAEGCDAEAHRVALECGSPTVVVLGHGHDHTYPRHHHDLFNEVIRHGGALVSPYWPTVAPRGFRFRERNSVIAQLSRSVVVVRARQRSGSLSTARFAMKLGRPVLALPSNVGDSYGRGSNELLAEGAVPMVGPEKLAETLDVPLRRIKTWPMCERGSPSPWSDEALSGYSSPNPVELSSDGRMVLNLLKTDALLDLDDLHMRSGLSVARLSVCLLNLEVQGVVHRTESDEYFLP